MNRTLFQVGFTAAGLLYPGMALTSRIPLAQAVHESANFTSHVCETTGNFFGMKPPKARNTTCTNKGTADAYAHFSSGWDCIRDYWLWAQARGLTDDAKLLAFIKGGGYAEDKQYYSKLLATVLALDKAGAYLPKPLILAAGLTAAGAAGAGGAIMVQAVADILTDK